MNKCFKYFSLSIILLVLMTSQGVSQVNVKRCGTTIEDQAVLAKIIRQNRANPALEPRSGETIYVPMIYHLVGKKDGTGRFDRIDKVLDAICKLNEDYGKQGIVFYLDGVSESIKELNHNAAYDNPKAAFGSAKLRSTANNSQNHHAVNVFVVHDIQDNNNPGEILGYYTNNGDYVVMKEKEIRSPSSTFAHELGHYFSLMHTFYGWEGRQYNYNEPTPTAIFYGGKSILTEYVSRTKMQGNKKLCEVASDQLCDTEANYKLGFGFPGCKWTGQAKDPDNVPLKPQENNFMSYFLNCTDYEFTNEQGEMMKRNYNSPQRDYLRKLPAPDLSVPGTTTLRFPENNQALDYYDIVKLDWDDAPNASHYLVERGSRKSFSTGYLSIIVDKSEIVFTDLDKRRNYYWRVTPINETHLCNTPSPTYRFKTGSGKYNATVDLKGVDHWSILHNPSSSDQNPRLLIQTTQQWNGSLNISSTTGKIMFTRPVRFEKGTTSLDLTEKLSPGLYLVSLSHEGIRDTKKLLIVK